MPSAASGSALTKMPCAVVEHEPFVFGLWNKPAQSLEHYPNPPVSNTDNSGAKHSLVRTDGAHHTQLVSGQDYSSFLSLGRFHQCGTSAGRARAAFF